LMEAMPKICKLPRYDYGSPGESVLLTWNPDEQRSCDC
jgi:hypothetical protein